MRRSLAALVAAAAVLAVAGSAARAGNYAVPPGDLQPVISPDASAVVFVRFPAQRPSLWVTGPSGDGTRPLPIATTGAFALSRTWQWVARSDEPGTDGIVVSHPEGSDRRVVAAGKKVIPPLSFSPDESRLAFADLEDVWIVGIDGAEPVRVHSGWSPTWSPSRDAIAFVDGKRVLLATLTAGDAVGDVRDLGAAGSPHLRWSPDGSRIAFAAKDAIVVVRVADASRRIYPARGTSSDLAWSPDSRRLAYIGSRGIYVVSPVTPARQRRLAAAFPDQRGFGPTGLDWAPRGGWLVFSWNGACHDRVGLYRVLETGASAPVRVTNQCRIDGTNGPDTISGTPLFDLIVGGGGDDLLTADDELYQGDDLYGGNGADTLTGGFYANVLDGGAGADRLDGGMGDDTLRGGPGRDVLLGGRGKDTIYARDGERDVVDCGFDGPFGPGRPDVAYVDAADVVANCERVYRR